MTSDPREKCPETAAESNAPTKPQPVEAVGTRHPIELPLLAFGDIMWTMGKEIGSGSFSSIFEVRGAHPPRVYKVTRQSNLHDGDEIRIAKVAGEIGVGPPCHRAFLVEHNGETYVFVEMDHVGRSLRERLNEITESGVVGAEAPSKEKTRMEMIRQIQADRERDLITVFKILHQLYESDEAFYYELFSKIKMLAERNIAYGDTNVGNILPEPTGLRLIDFGTARIEVNPKKAAATAMQSPCNRVWWRQFNKLPNLSETSQALIKWFSQ